MDERGKVDISQPSALSWFLEVYPSLMEHERPLEYTQQPGETLFVPSGWWHLVINLDMTIAVTQNFASENNLADVCEDLLHNDPKMYQKLKSSLLTAEGPKYEKTFNEVEEKEVEEWIGEVEQIFVLETKLLEKVEAQDVEKLSTCGKNTVFRVGLFVIKLFPERDQYDKELRGYKHLENVEEAYRQFLLSVKFSGKLSEKNHFYIVTDFVECEALRFVPLDLMSNANWDLLVDWLAHVLKGIHSVVPSDPGYQKAQFIEYIALLQRQCKQNHQRWRHLPPGKSYTY